jgi:predicted metal-dependent HD superfamily phosphohydrolase
MSEHLREKFSREVGVGDVDPDAVIQELSEVIRRYNENHRHYHNLTHVTRLLELYDELDQNDPDLILAIFYHDVVYKPGSSKNEEKSAAFARKSLGRLGVDPSRINLICEMITATADHLNPPADPLTRIFLDLDMSILGSPREEYKAYAEGVRKEHPRIPEIVFRKNRRKFLEKILAAQSIYCTDLFREKYEAAARANIDWEINL